MFKILVTDYQWDNLKIERGILAPLPGELIVAETGEEEELIRLAPPADAILTCWKPTTARVIDAAPRCRIITRYGVGLDNIAVDHATRLGIPVTNAPTYCVDEVAEHALGLAFALARRIPRFDRTIRGGSYPGEAFRGIHRVAGRTLGLLGYGNIARQVAARARGVGMKVLTHDPAVPRLPEEEGRAVDFASLLREADFVSLHVPLNPKTKGLIGAEALALMKPSAFLINTARGALVELDPLLAALEQGRLAGAALDVFPQEPPPLEHPLFRHPLFIATPHCAFYSEESVENLQHTSAGQVFQALSGQTPGNIVNPDYRNHTPRFQRG
jgi:D-3-phosphoglycerate dehydrogenase